MTHFTVDGKPVGYSSWAAELEAFFEDLAEHPRERHEAEDFASRAHDFVAALTRSGDAGVSSPPRGAPATVTRLSHGTDASRAEAPLARRGADGGAGAGRSPSPGGVSAVASWERFAWIPDEAA